MLRSSDFRRGASLPEGDVIFSHRMEDARIPRAEEDCLVVVFGHLRAKQGLQGKAEVESKDSDNV